MNKIKLLLPPIFLLLCSCEEPERNHPETEKSGVFMNMLGEHRYYWLSIMEFKKTNSRLVEISQSLKIIAEELKKKGRYNP